MKSISSYSLVLNSNSLRLNLFLKVQCAAIRVVLCLIVFSRILLHIHRLFVTCFRFAISDLLFSIFICPFSILVKSLSGLRCFFLQSASADFIWLDLIREIESYFFDWKYCLNHFRSILWFLLISSFHFWSKWYHLFSWVILTIVFDCWFQWFSFDFLIEILYLQVF